MVRRRGPRNRLAPERLGAHGAAGVARAVRAAPEWLSPRWPPWAGQRVPPRPPRPRRQAPRMTPSLGASRGGQHRFGRSGRDIQRHALVIVNLLALVVILR